MNERSKPPEAARHPLGRMVAVGIGAISAPKLRGVSLSLCLSDQDLAKILNADVNTVAPMLLEESEDRNLDRGAPEALEDLDNIASLLRSLINMTSHPWSNWLNSHDQVLDGTPRNLLFDAAGRSAVTARLRAERSLHRNRGESGE